MPSLNSVTFDTTGLTPVPQPAGEVSRSVWQTAERDAVLLYFFAKPPDIPSGLRSVDEYRQAALGSLRASAAKMVEADIVDLASMRATRLIIKIPQQPHGMTYLGSFTLPFRDFSFVLKIQCVEQGVTGMRETILLNRALANKTVTIDPSATDGHIKGPWNPDDERHDAEFPKHPLSRVRRLLGRIQSSLSLDAATAGAPPFPLPDPDAQT